MKRKTSFPSYLCVQYFRYIPVLTVTMMLTACSLFKTQEATRQKAQVHESAPEFALPGHDGNTYKLSDFRGKYVVLEWFNNDCPFVKKHYNSGNMQEIQKKITSQDILWFSIVSSAPGKQGHISAEEAMAIKNQRQSAQTAILLDPTGKVGKMYGAKATPHMFVITPKGTILYNGAIDDNSSSNPKTIQGSRNYVTEVLNATLSGAPVNVHHTKPYGCSIKYEVTP